MRLTWSLSDPGCLWLTNKHQKTVHLLLSLERENLSDNSSSRMILQNCSSGCCESTMILSPSFCLVSFYSTNLSCVFFNTLWFQVGEDEEVSIKEVTDAIVKAVGFQGEYTVCCPPSFYLFAFLTTIFILHQPSSSIPHVQMVNSVNLLRTKSYCLWLEGSNSRLSLKVSLTSLMLWSLRFSDFYVMNKQLWI